MLIRAAGLICAVRPHGEHGAVVRLLTAEHGLRHGYVRGGRSRRLRPVLMPGNGVAAELRARTDTQLAALTVELLESRAPLHGEPMAAAAIDWATALTAIALPEAQPYPRLYAALGGLLAAIEAAPSARLWAGALARYELLLLAELGFGLDLARCAATGAGADLVYVSPRSGQAVSRAAGEPYAARLLPLPGFLLAGGEADWPALLDGFRLTGFFLARDLLGGAREAVLDARERLLARLRRLAGP
ncbi:DNA repair protein RecO [Sphingomonas morindae]|uniref:DNA repair protein RecO n=1 Tax=Sphingomonas morindae TaxID=1541170 RepID=A0ABY4XAV1_9SPHN|nr:DNA repair protein RecO [Sphingomonas morindae]USI73820.1 DNA repair protein RecO [Sphingomonas morindae]